MSKLAWSCDEKDRKNCRNAHGCHCREITELLRKHNGAAVKMYTDALDAANARIAELEAREWQWLRDLAYAAVMPIDPPHHAISAAMRKIPEDGCEYEHIEAAYRAIRTSLVSSTVCATCGGLGRIPHESGGYGINCPTCSVPSTDRT